MNEDHTASKRLKSDELDKFIDWCKSVHIYINYDKVTISQKGTSHGYGMIAVKDIERDEILARIPKSSILEPNTSDLKEVISKNKCLSKSKSKWSKLIVTIMHEFNNPNSKWSTYLRIFLNKINFDLPMFWPKDFMIENLSDTCIVKNVEVDLKNMKKEFEKIILPFLNEHKDLFNDAKYFDFDFYKEIAGFIMSYSFRDPSEDADDEKSIGPMMVPIADALNHIAKNNAQIRFEKNELVIVSTKQIKTGEEVYNTYGEQSNTDLLHMYGFVQTYPENIYDSVEIPSVVFVECANNLFNNVIDKKIEVLREIELIDDDMGFVIGMDGILNEEELLHSLQILSMSATELSEFIDNEYEMLEDEEWDKYSLLNENLHKLPIDWKMFLKECCTIHLEKLNKYLKQDMIEKDVRIEKIRILKNGHVKILNEFIKFLKI